MIPGHTALTRMRYGEASMASHRVRPMTAALPAQYAAIISRFGMVLTGFGTSNNPQLTSDVDDTSPLTPNPLPADILPLHDPQFFLYTHPQSPIIHSIDLVKRLYRTLIGRTVVPDDASCVDSIVQSSKVGSDLFKEPADEFRI